MLMTDLRYSNQVLVVETTLLILIIKSLVSQDYKNQITPLFNNLFIIYKFYGIKFLFKMNKSLNYIK